MEANPPFQQGGMWILLIIAAMQLKARIVYYSSDGKEARGMTNEDILGLAFALHDPAGMSCTPIGIEMMLSFLSR